MIDDSIIIGLALEDAIAWHSYTLEEWPSGVVDAKESNARIEAYRKLKVCYPVPREVKERLTLLDKISGSHFYLSRQK